MNRVISFIVISGLLFSFVMACMSDRSNEKQVVSGALQAGGEKGITSRKGLEFLKQRDPATGKIPRGIRMAEIKYSEGLPASHNFGSEKSLLWIPRGPYNVGGRTRGADVDKTNENIIVAGGVSGGVWRTTDAGNSWTKVTQPMQFHNVTTLIQDKRNGNTNNWYFGTGEYTGNSAGSYGADYLGNGVYKSTDNGLSWFSLPSTASNTPEAMDSSWDYIWRLAVDPSRLDSSIIYAAIYQGIMRSNDGGNSWKKVIRAGSGSSNAYSDIAVTSSGVVYAAFRGQGATRANIWRSENGYSWTNITPTIFPLSFKRVVIGINPSNENEVYFFANTPNSGQISVTFTNETEGNSLFKYTYISGNGAGTNGAWTNLSANLPNAGSTNFDNLYVQGSYNMYIAVKPDDPNVIFIGGTNLYRSTDGFTTPNNVKQIGGYRIGSYFPDWDIYKNHHPDQHGFLFLQSQPDALITYNDGGLYKTSNCLADTVVWSSLNRGYRNSQVYTVNFNKFQNNDILIGGFQDNGNFFTNSANPEATWTMPLNGDGSYGAISNDGSTYYLSIQQGRLYKMNLDANGIPLAFNRIDPYVTSSSAYVFINPFVLDPMNNDNLYMLWYNSVYRNNALSQIPLSGSYDTSSVGWKKLPNSADTYIMSLAISSNPANRLYYGTLNGTIYRRDSANAETSGHTVISNYPHYNFYTSCIAVDSKNGNNVMVVYSNYRVYSLFFSDDAGNTWKKVAGNLEQNPDGSGNGPSCRWASMLHVGNKTIYFVGTSVGLFATDTLVDNGTVWTRVGAESIGNVVINMVETRDTDGLVVVGTHGNGIYSAHITSADILLGRSNEKQVFASEPEVFPNPVADFVNLKCFSSKNENCRIEIFDLTGKFIKSETRFLHQGENILRVETNSFRQGKYFAKIIIGKEVKVKSFVKVS